MSETVLITGICGGLAQMCAETLQDQGHTVVGVDYRPKRPGLRAGIVFYKANYNKTRIADVFRRHKPSRVLHLGRVGNLKTHANKRFDLNVVGSAKIKDLALEHGVKRMVVMSTFHIYGAHKNNHIPIFEDEPLRAGQNFPQLADAVQADNQAVRWSYQHRTLKTAVLRPCNVVGPSLRNAVSRFLRSPAIPYLMGFAPMWQFIHQDDMRDALLLALWDDTPGAFNVAGASAVPITKAIELVGARALPIPALLAKQALRYNRSVPPYYLNFLRYPCVVSTEKFHTAVGFKNKIGIEETLRATMLGAPAA